jgi:hypothetical protein
LKTDPREYTDRAPRPRPLLLAVYVADDANAAAATVHAQRRQGNRATTHKRKVKAGNVEAYVYAVVVRSGSITEPKP